MSRKSCPINLLPGYGNQPIPRLVRVRIHCVQKEGWGRWHGLRLTDVPAAASLLRLLGKSQRLNSCAFNPQFGGDTVAALISRGVYARKSRSATPGSSHRSSRAPRKPRQDLHHCADAANWNIQDKPRTHPSEQFAIGSQHEEDLDGNGLAPVQDVTCVQN
jgi:hypothetical protein